MRRLLPAVAVFCLVVLPASAAETVDAAWSEREVEFTFFGFDVAYSCDMAIARITMLLRHVGAEDIDVTTSPCPGFDRPQKRIPIVARFKTLVSAGEGDADVVKAVWSEVELGKRRPQSIDDHDCELLEQFQKFVLPEVEHELIGGAARCGAARSSIAGRLRLKVLKPVVANPPPSEDG